MSSWGKFWTKKKKERPKNPTVTSEEPGAKQGVGSKSRIPGHGPLHTPPPKG